MRRTVSVILFILGGWILAAEVMMAFIDLRFGVGAQLAMIGIYSAFALPFLLLAMWASPGNRFSDIGLTIMIAAGVGVALGLMMWTMLADPNFRNLLPPGKPMPNLQFSLAYGVVNLLMVFAIGFASWSAGRSRREAPDLERVFGDR